MCSECTATHPIHSKWLLQIEGQQSERNKVQQEKAALAKLDRIKQDQGKRADDLEREAADAESKVSYVMLCTRSVCDHSIRAKQQVCSKMAKA